MMMMRMMIMMMMMTMTMVMVMVLVMMMMTMMMAMTTATAMSHRGCSRSPPARPRGRGRGPHARARADREVRGAAHVLVPGAEAQDGEEVRRPLVSQFRFGLRRVGPLRLAGRHGRADARHRGRRVCQGRGAPAAEQARVQATCCFLLCVAAVVMLLPAGGWLRNWPGCSTRLACSSGSPNTVA